jgi:hypothetical protein
MNLVCLVTATANDGPPNTASAWSQALPVAAIIPPAGLTVTATPDTVTVANTSTYTDLAVTVATPGTGGAGSLTYSWAMTGPVGAVATFSAATAAATRHTFNRAGSYTFTVTVTNADSLGRPGLGRRVTGSVAVTVVGSPTGLLLTPVTAFVPLGGFQQFIATLVDQFNVPIIPQPDIAWSVNPASLGSVTGSGVFTPLARGTGTITATTTVAPIYSATASVIVGDSTVVKVNFQPATSPQIRTWVMDSGLGYGARGNGLTYGWIRASDGTPIDMSWAARDRNDLRGVSPSLPIITSGTMQDEPSAINQMWDTCIHMQRLAGNDQAIERYYGAPIKIDEDVAGVATDPRVAWRIAVPNGSYSVYLICGDCAYVNSQFDFYVQNLRIFPNPASPVFDGRFGQWFNQSTGLQTVDVTDGTLTISNGPGAVNNKLCGVVLMKISDLPAPPLPGPATNN